MQSTTPTTKRPKFTFGQILEGIEGIIIALLTYLTFFLRPWRDRWGLTKAEAARHYPGDEIVPEPITHFTHGIEVNAPAAEVWPWIAQIGQGRGGFYSYEALENIMGYQIYNADEILPECQDIQLGDPIHFDPKTSFPIVVLEPGRAMAVGAHLDLDTQEQLSVEALPQGNYLKLTWLFFVEPLSETTSRVISRCRLNYRPDWKNRLLIGHLTEPMVFTMDRKMLKGIKQRAENR